MATTKSATPVTTEFAWSDDVIDSFAAMAANQPTEWAVSRGALIATNPAEIAEAESRALAIQRAHHYTSIVASCVDKADRENDFAEVIGALTDAMLNVAQNVSILKETEGGARGESKKYWNRKAVIHVGDADLAIHYRRPFTK